MQRLSYENVLNTERLELIQKARDGFTKIELLVTASIIGLLAALILPAIQQSREAARKAQFASSMGQIARAQLMFHDTHGYFAPAVGKAIVAEGDAEAGEILENVTWPVNLRPHMEAKFPYNTLHSPYFQAQETYDATMHTLSPTIPGGTSVLAVVGNSLPDVHNPAPHFFADPQAAMNGAMPVDPFAQPTKIADFTDGASNTLMFVEGSLDPNMPKSNPYPIPADEVRRYWSPYYGAAYISVSGKIATTGADSWSKLIHPGTSRSSGAIITAKADGSVSTISQNVDGKVLRALATRSGQEP